MLRRVLQALLAVAALLALSAFALRCALSPPSLRLPPSGLELTDVTVVNPGLGREPGRSLLVEGERIAAIEAAYPSLEDPLAGLYALPGLVDLHVHHPPSFAIGERELFALLFLAHGVTSVRDAGSGSDTLYAHRERLASGELAGPRLFSCGRFLDGEPPGWPGARVVDGAEDARRAVDEQLEAGADCVKVYNGLSEPEVAAVVQQAAARGLPVVAHVPWAVPVEALHDVEVQHLMGLTPDWRRVGRPQIERYVRTALEQRTRHTPTLVAFARTARLTDLAALRLDPVAQLLPPYYRQRVWDPAQNPIVFRESPQGGSGVELRLAVMQRVVARLHAEGVALLAGTDTLNPFVVPGASLHEELALLAEAGLGPEQALAAATSRAGEALRVPQLGLLRPGAPADLALFREDPTRDLAALGTLEAVVVRGRLFRRAELEAAVAAMRGHFAGALPRTLSDAAARLALRVLRDY